MLDADQRPHKRSPISLFIRLTVSGSILSALLWIGIAIALYSLVRANPRPPHRVAAVTFRHVYPPNPVAPGPTAAVRRGPLPTRQARLPIRIVTRSRRPLIQSLSALTKILPPGTLDQTSSGTWELHQPLRLSSGTTLTLAGPVTLDLAPGAFVEVSDGAAIWLQGVTVQAVDAVGAPASSALATRGYLDIGAGGGAVLVGDTFNDLGSNNADTYGVALDGAKAALISGCSFQHDFYGLYLTGLSGGTITDNQVVDSARYGLEVRADHNLLISNNDVTGSAIHGIELDAGSLHNRLLGNTVTASGDRGVMVDQASNDNLIAQNQVNASFDGITVQDSVGNLLTGNNVGSVKRFGLEITGPSSSNVSAYNVFKGAIVGTFIDQGATDNHLVGNFFRHNYENVRARRSSHGNSVSPRPSDSEL